MARKGNDENPVSLFPFLSILACVIGTLILLIASVSLTQIQSDPEEELVERVEEYEELEEEQSEVDEELAKMLEQLASLDEFQKRLEELQKQEQQLKRDQQQVRQENKELQEQLAKLDEERKKLLEEIQKLKAKIADQEELIAKLIEEIQRRRMVNSAPTVRVEPAPQAVRGTKPTFVEVDQEGLILDPGGKKIRVPANKIGDDPNFKKLLGSMAGERDKILVLLIREDGYRLYATTERTARYSNVIVTKLPIVGDGQLDLSKF